MVDGITLKSSGSTTAKDIAESARDSVTETADTSRRKTKRVGGTTLHFSDNDDIDLLHDVAHWLHFASIAVLGFLVLEVSAKIGEKINSCQINSIK